MKRTTSRQDYPLIRAAFILLIILLAAYIPLKIYMSRAGKAGTAVPDGSALSIFVTSELNGYREPCG